MSEIHVRRGEKSMYAQMDGSDNNKYVQLGVRQVAGVRLSPMLGVNLDLARAEAVPIETHNAFEIYWANAEKPSANIAVLGLIANMMMPEELQQTHPDVIKMFSREINVAEARIQGLAGNSELVEEMNQNPGLYKLRLPFLLQNLAHMDKMLHHPEPNARDWLVSENGIITASK